LGVSQLALARAQFVSVVKIEGIDAPIAILKKKTDNFSKKSGK